MTRSTLLFGLLCLGATPVSATPLVVGGKPAGEFILPDLQAHRDSGF